MREDVPPPITRLSVELELNQIEQDSIPLKSSIAVFAWLTKFAVSSPCDILFLKLDIVSTSEPPELLEDDSQVIDRSPL